LPMINAMRFSAKALTAVVARIAAAKRTERNEIIAQISPCRRIIGARLFEQRDFGSADS
jgi:hypothetical protein